MSVIIKASSVISPQPTCNATGFPEVLELVADRLACMEPEYRNLINPVLLRRMPRILKMGLASSQLCISRSANIRPDGIIVGTGLGCLDNLEKFLKEVLDTSEHVRSVLPFINSTHNTVAAQISMLLKNKGYNITYCHKGFSFESALQDAVMLIEEQQAENVLIGGIDECTDDFILLHHYLNDWKKQPISNLNLFSDGGPGTIAGEGAAFFMLSRETKADVPCVAIHATHTFLTRHTSDASEVVAEILWFLNENGISTNEIDGVLLGLNGDPQHDRPFFMVQKELFANQTILCYKHLCGEYYTSMAFALWLGYVVIEQQTIPDVITLKRGHHAALKNLLIYNQVNNTEHSLIYLNYGHI
jgi:3-oxoacyl-[acyl-carrier-protein] synthase II